MAKIKEDYIKRINLIREDALRIATNLGELEFQKASIQILVDEQKDAIKSLKKQELDLMTEIEAEYGKVTINLETGEIS